MWRKDKYYVLHGMTLNWWFTLQKGMRCIEYSGCEVLLSI